MMTKFRTMTAKIAACLLLLCTSPFLSPDRAHADSFSLSREYAYGEGYQPHWYVTGAIGYYLGDFHSAIFSLNLGYRFLSWFSMDIEQFFFAGQLYDSNDKYTVIGGRTMLNFKFIYAHETFGDFYLNISPLGWMYHRYVSGSPFDEYDDNFYQCSIGIGYNYYITDDLAIGANVKWVLFLQFDFQAQVSYLF